MTDPELHIIRRYLMSDGNGEPSSASLSALREQLVPRFVREGLVPSAAANGAVDRWTRLAFRVIETLARDPF
ncbi:MAG: hypothetical protein ACRD2X_23250, partial [Vicinamibacteraceae bacterium]